MKASHYNLYAKNKTKNTVCFNTKLDAFCILSNKDLELLKTNIPLLASQSPNVYNALVEKGFIIEDNIDEYKQLCEEYESATNNNSIYRLTILPSLDCNLRCWYCFEKHIQGSHLENKTSDSIFRFVENLFENNPNLEALDVELFGGEPLLYFEKELYPLLNKIKNHINDLGKNVSFFFVTNAVCINEETIPLFKELKANFQISIDGFKDRHDKIKFIPDTQIGTYNHVIQIIHRLTEEIDSCYINLRINYDDETLSHMEELIKDLSSINRNKIGIHLERVWQTIGFSNYENEELKSIINTWMLNGFTISYMNMHRRSYACNASVNNQCIISYNGEIYKCAGRDFTPKHKDGVLNTDGSITWDKKKLEERLNIQTYNNDMCRDCKFLPLCWGPCSQKQMESKDKDFTRYCQKRNMEISIADYIRYRFNNAYIKSHRI